MAECQACCESANSKNGNGADVRDVQCGGMLDRLQRGELELDTAYVLSDGLMAEFCETFFA
jgi:hypothetical protein